MTEDKPYEFKRDGSSVTIIFQDDPILSWNLSSLDADSLIDTMNDLYSSTKAALLKSGRALEIANDPSLLSKALERKYEVTTIKRGLLGDTQGIVRDGKTVMEWRGAFDDAKSIAGALDGARSMGVSDAISDAQWEMSFKKRQEQEDKTCSSSSKKLLGP